MARLRTLEIDELTPAQREVLETINRGPRGRRGSIGMVGPYGVWVRSPNIGTAAQALGSAARFDTALREDIKEIAICTVGAFTRAKFEFSAHARLAANAGVDQPAIERLRERKDPLLKGDQQSAWRVASALMSQHRLADDMYEEAIGAFGEEGLIELVTIIGYYVMVSMTLNVFHVPLGAGMSDPFPEIEE